MIFEFIVTLALVQMGLCKLDVLGGNIDEIDWLVKKHRRQRTDKIDTVKKKSGST